MLHLGYLNYTQYQVMVSFKGLENITYEIKVKFVVSDKLAFVFLLSSRVSRSRFTLSFPPQWKTYNPTFSQVEIWFRFVFVVLTFMVTVRAQITFQILISMNFTWPVFQSDQNGLTFFFSLRVPVFVCTLPEKVFYEGLGHRTEVDVYPAPFAAALQWWASVLSLIKLGFSP